jgi:hypothetical protein
MTKENDEYRLELLKKRHKHLHAVVEALEAEKAPEKHTKKIKVEKLSVKDEITKIESKISLQSH